MTPAARTGGSPYRRALSSHDARAIIRADVPERLDGPAYAALEGLLDGRGAEPSELAVAHPPEAWGEPS